MIERSGRGTKEGGYRYDHLLNPHPRSHAKKISYDTYADISPPTFRDSLGFVVLGIPRILLGWGWFYAGEKIRSLRRKLPNY